MRGILETKLKEVLKELNHTLSGNTTHENRKNFLLGEIAILIDLSKSEKEG